MSRTIPLLVFCLIFTGCALKVAPTGGKPDTTPTHVASISPPSGTRNLTNPEFTVEFDDYVDRSIRNDITVIPAARINSSYSGNEISIWFDDVLKSNTTYAITIGTNWKDLRGNSAQEATNIIFSTGPDIDSGSIQGKISARGFQNLVIFVYPNSDTLGSTFDARKTIAPYQVPVGTMGAFAVSGLRDGLYRVIAVRDGNRNGLVDFDEEYGTAQKDIQIDKGALARCTIVLGKSMAAQKDTASSHSEQHDTSQVAKDSLLVPADSVKPTYPGSMEGTFSGPLQTIGSYIVRFLDQRGNVAATVTVEPNRSWQVAAIPAGEYTADAFVDLNADGIFSHGTVFPFAFAEPHFALNTSIVVRERWTTENISLVLSP